MSIKPLKMPDLSALPTPEKDLFGGMTRPDALMSMGHNQVESLLNPKPLFSQDVKLSKQAQQTVGDITRQQNELVSNTNKLAEQANAQNIAATEEWVKASQARVKENERRTKELLAATQQKDGLLGAGGGGELMLQQDAQRLIETSGWQGIVSNMQRDDEMERWLTLAEGRLREMGVTDDAVIKAELDAARSVISGDTEAYTTRMKEDNIDPLDFISSLGKGARTIYRGAGILFGASDEWAKNEQQAINSITSTYSDTMLLDQANYAYTRSKTKAENPDEGLIEGFASGVKDAWNSGSILTSVVDTAGYVPYAVVGTAAAGAAVSGAGAATGLTGITTAITGEAAALSAAGGQLVGGVLSAETAGAAVTSGLLAATDAAGGAYDSVMAMDLNDPNQLETVKNNYTSKYGQANWDSLVTLHNGDMGKVKADLATKAGRVAGGTAFITAAPLGIFGLEESIARIGTQGVAAQAGKRLLTVGANTVSETLEEGFTQLSQNIGARPVTGVSLTDDVGATAAMGAIAGGGMSAGSQATANLSSSVPASRTSFSSDSLSASNWVSEGNINYDAYRSVVGHQMENVATDGRKINLSEDDIQQLQQRVFNDYIDNGEIWARMPQEQQIEFKDYLRLSYNINTNDYARHQETVEAKAWASNDVVQITNAITDNPHSADLLNAYRVKNNVELEQVPPQGREYFRTLADVLDTLQAQDSNVSTQEREVQAMKIIADKVKGNDKLTDVQKRSVTMFTMNSMDAGSRRMVDEQQVAYDKVAQAAQRMVENQTIGKQNGATEQNQEPSSILTGQGETAQDVGAVTSQSTTDGAGSSGARGAITEELATSEPTRQGDGNVESVGSDVAQQTPVSRFTENDTPASSSGVGGNGEGSGQAQITRNPQHAPAASTNSRSATATGVIGSPYQSEQSIGQANPNPAEASVSSGSAGAAEAERDTASRSQQVTTPKIVDAAFLSDPSNKDYVKSFIQVAYNDLGKFGQGITKHKGDLRKLLDIKGAVGASLTSPAVNKLYAVVNMEPSSLTTLINNKFRTQATTNRVHNAVHYLKTNVVKSIKTDLKRAGSSGRKKILTSKKAVTTTPPGEVTTTPSINNGAPTSYVTDQSGNPLTLYHARENSSLKLDPLLGNEFGVHFGDKDGASIRAGGMSSPRVIKVNLRMDNPVRLIDPDSMGYGAWDAHTVARGLTQAGVPTDVRELQTKFYNFVYAQEESNTTQWGNPLWNEFAINYIKGLGYDGVVYKNVTEGNADSYIALDTNQIDILPEEGGSNETQRERYMGDGDETPSERTPEKNRENFVGDLFASDVGQGEVPSPRGPEDGERAKGSGVETENRPVGKTGEGTGNDAAEDTEVEVSAPVSYPSQLSTEERAAIEEVANYEGVSSDVVYEAIAREDIKFFKGYGASNGAGVAAMAQELVNQEIATNVKQAEKLMNRLTTPPTVGAAKSPTGGRKKYDTASGAATVEGYLTQNGQDKAELSNYLTSERNRLAALVEEELDVYADLVEQGDMAQADQAHDRAVAAQTALKSLPPTAAKLVEESVVDGELLPSDKLPRALPDSIKTIIDKIIKSLRGAVAAVSMAIAVYSGASFVVPNEVLAATPVETATVQHVVNTNDNFGKPIIVADKTAGTLTVYTPTGQEVTSTPALFGKTIGDSISTRNTTPSGRYDLTRATNISNKTYGESAQVLTVGGELQTNNSGNLAIHRVLTTIPAQNRVGRLKSATPEDNRVSLGCINVPTGFYDSYLTGDTNAVVYVLPETEAGKTGIFANVPEVPPRMDDANARSVELSPQDIIDAPTQIEHSPYKALAPVTISGVRPSEQVAYVAPVVTGGVTIDQITVPFEVLTPAELRADSGFDTEPLPRDIRADDGAGDNIYGIAAILASLGAAGVAAQKRGKKLSSKKATTSAPERGELAKDLVDTNHNNVVNRAAGHVIKNAAPPAQKTPLADAVTRAMWLDYITNSHLTIEKNDAGEMVEGGEIYAAFLDAMLGFEWAINDVMSDRTIEQANDDTFKNPLKWRNDISDGTRAGISAKLMNLAAGATQVFDNLMTEHNIARVGHEMDSSIPSKHLAQVKAKASGAYTQIHKLYIKPLVTKVDILAGDLRTGYVELENDIGRIATVEHVLNEAASAMWRGRERVITEHGKQLAAVNGAISNTPEGSEVRLTLTTKAKLLQKEIAKQTELLKKARDMYEGAVPHDGETGLPGGYTKSTAQQTLSDLRSKHGENFPAVKALAAETVSAIRGIRNFAAASGVFSNTDLQTFKELGFTEYVPLYSVQKDPLAVDESETYTKRSIMDELTAELPAQQAGTMGLTKDLSRYHREGATSPAEDAFTNMKVFSMNMAGRIGQQGWLNSVQQLYEGTVGKPISATIITDPQELAEINATHDSGKLPGLIRVRPGMEKYKGIDNAKNRPIVAKGYNSHGELVAYNYYFTDPAVQAEIYSNSNLTETLALKGMKNVGSMTRLAARMVTTFKPVWNIYNWSRDSLERISIMLMRPVKDSNGVLVDKWGLSRAYFKNLAVLASSPTAQSEIYRYLVTGETTSSLQKRLHEAVGEGAINLMTSQTERHSIVADLSKSTVDKLASHAVGMLGAGFNKIGAGKVKRGADKLVEMYVLRLTEVPQVTTALAAYMAYQDVGVNKGETANRVRDQFDPTRAKNKVLSSASQMYPFIRSTFSGHYNLARTLSEYWKPDTWQAPLAYMVAGTVGTMAVLTMMAGMFGDDEDGVPRIARLPVGTLMNGIPVPVGETGVWSMPVGFGLNKLTWGVGANLWRQSMGMQTGGDTTTQLLGLVADNTSPIQFASGEVMTENPATGITLTMTPLLVKPIMEVMTNTKSFGGSKIIYRETGKDQYDSDQDNFNVPETYKKWAKALRKTTGVDMRPETVRHLFESYMWGPAGAIPKSIIQDTSEKSLGNKQRKGEIFGPLLSAIGADMAIQPNALDYARHTYAMQDLRMELHRKYGVGASHDEDTYAKYANRGKRGGVIKQAAVVTERALRAAGAPEDVIKYVGNGMRYNIARRKANKKFNTLAKDYYTLRQKGKEDLSLRAEVQAAWDDLDELTYNFVKENNRAYFEIMQRQ